MAEQIRLERRIRRDFPEPGSAQEILRTLSELATDPEIGEYDKSYYASERVQTAIILMADGKIHRFRQAVALAWKDWRDALVAGGLAHDDWPARLDEELGPDDADGQATQEE